MFCLVLNTHDISHEELGIIILCVTHAMCIKELLPLFSLFDQVHTADVSNDRNLVSESCPNVIPVSHSSFCAYDQL